LNDGQKEVIVVAKIPVHLNRRARERLRKKHEILDAAREVIKENGIMGATIAEIAKRAEFAKGTLYSYFKNKDDIFLSIIIEDSLHEIEELVAILEEPYDPEEVLRREFENFYKWMSENKELFRFIHLEGHEGAKVTQEEASEELWESFWTTNLNKNRLLQKVALKGQELGLFRKDIEARWMPFALYSACYTFHLAVTMGESNIPQEIKTQSEIILNIILEGIKQK
jgi:AcrR family transcriptional regulator